MNVAPPKAQQLSMLRRRADDIMALRKPFEKRWRDCAAYNLPTAPQWAVSDANRGDRSRTRIVDLTPCLAIDQFASGMMAGLAGSDRPWFDFSTSSKELDQVPAVARWLERARDILLETMTRSNWYTALERCIRDEGVFATSTMGIFEDPERIMRCEVLPVGSYAIAQDERGMVKTVIREVAMTAQQAAGKFGFKNLRPQSQEALRNQVGHQTKVRVRHLVEEAGHGIVDGLNRPVREVYWEEDSVQGEAGEAVTWASGPQYDAGDGILAVGSYTSFPFATARWGRNEADVWGTECPGFKTLGDTKQLMAMRIAMVDAVDKMIDPPLVAGPGVSNEPISQMAGGVTYTSDVTGGGSGLVPLYELAGKIPIHEVHNIIIELRESVKAGWMVPIFLMLMEDTRQQPPTAQEVRALERERTKVLGPVQASHESFLDAAVGRAFDIHVQASKFDWSIGQDGLLPAPPKELQGRQLRVKHTSEIARLLKQSAMTNVEAHVAFAAEFSQVSPEAMDNIDMDAVIAAHAEGYDVPMSIRRDPDEVAEVREARAAVQEQAAQMEQLEQAASAAQGFAAAEGAKQ